MKTKVMGTQIDEEAFHAAWDAYYNHVGERGECVSYHGMVDAINAYEAIMNKTTVRVPRKDI